MSHQSAAKKKGLNTAEVVSQVGARERRRGPRSGRSYPSRRGEKLVEGLNKAELVRKYEPKVRYIAAKMATQLPDSVEIDDLISVGFIGLMDAADKFNAAKGVKFSTYAEFRIRGAILDELRNQDWVPHCARGRARTIDNAYHKLERENGERPSDSDLCKELGVSNARLNKLRDDLKGLHLVSYETQEAEIAKQAVEDRQGADPFAEMSRKDAKNFLEGLFSSLNEDERVVVSCYYFRGLNLREISDILGVSESRVSQLHTRAIFLLKQKVNREVQSVQQMFSMLLEG